MVEPHESREQYQAEQNTRRVFGREHGLGLRIQVVILGLGLLGFYCTQFEGFIGCASLFDRVSLFWLHSWGNTLVWRLKWRFLVFSTFCFLLYCLH